FALSRSTNNHKPLPVSFPGNKGKSGAKRIRFIYPRAVDIGGLWIYKRNGVQELVLSVLSETALRVICFLYGLAASCGDASHDPFTIRRVKSGHTLRITFAVVLFDSFEDVTDSSFVAGCTLGIRWRN